MTPAPRESSSTRAANWLALALATFPFLQLFPLDFDRTAPLLLVPGLWFGRETLGLALQRFLHGPLWLRSCAGTAVGATLLSIVFADQPAPALVQASVWWLLAAAALTAGRLSVANDNRTRLLTGLLLGGVLATMFTWFLWVGTDRGAMPMYANPRHLGIHLLSVVIAAAVLVNAEDISRARRIGWTLAGSIAWGGLLWSGGRTAVIGTAFGLTLWLWSLPAKRRLTQGALILGMVIAGALISLAFWTPRQEFGWWTMIRRTGDSIDQGSASALTTTRSDFWQETITRAKTAPWLGHGPDSYRFLTPKLDGQQPHNIFLQVWLDTGVLGAVPFLTLLVIALLTGVRRRSTTVAPWLAILGGSAGASLLDGYFYHLLALLPVSLAMGALLDAAVGSNDEPASPTSGFGTVLRSSVTLAGLILALHTALFHLIAVATPPPSAHTFSPRLVRAFPSASFGLWRWVEAWQASEPTEAMAWARWAQTHSPYAPYFHVLAARLLMQKGDRDGAAAEFQAAWRAAHISGRPTIEALQKQYGLAPGSTTAP